MNESVNVAMRMISKGGIALWIGVPVGLFVWEHIAITNGLKIRPTLAINQVTRACRAMWRFAGMGFAYLGSYYKYLHMEELGVTIMSFAKSFRDLITSGGYFWKGFTSVAKYYNHPGALASCSVLTLVIGAFLFQRFKGPMGGYLTQA